MGSHLLANLSADEEESLKVDKGRRDKFDDRSFKINDTSYTATAYNFTLEQSSSRHAKHILTSGLRSTHWPAQVRPSARICDVRARAGLGPQSTLVVGGGGGGGVDGVS